MSDLECSFKIKVTPVSNGYLIETNAHPRFQGTHSLKSFIAKSWEEMSLTLDYVLEEVKWEITQGLIDNEIYPEDCPAANPLSKL